MSEVLTEYYFDQETKLLKKIQFLEKQNKLLKECASFYAEFYHIRKNFGDQNPILESDEFGDEGTLNKAERTLEQINKMECER